VVVVVVVVVTMGGLIRGVRALATTEPKPISAITSSTSAYSQPDTETRLRRLRSDGMAWNLLRREYRGSRKLGLGHGFKVCSSHGLEMAPFNRRWAVSIHTEQARYRLQRWCSGLPCEHHAGRPSISRSFRTGNWLLLVEATRGSIGTSAARRCLTHSTAAWRSQRQGTAARRWSWRANPSRNLQCPDAHLYYEWVGNPSCDSSSKTERLSSRLATSHWHELLYGSLWLIATSCLEIESRSSFRRCAPNSTEARTAFNASDTSAMT